MYTKSPSRNNRSRGIKVKHILQICLLAAVCFWLIYQVKHSHDKKKEFDEKDAKLALDTQSGNEILRLGRKDISRVTETGTDDKLNGEDDEENEAEQAETRHEDDEQEIEESRTEEREDEEDAGKGIEDDEDKTEMKNEEDNHEEEFADEVKEDSDDGEKEDNEESEAVLEHQDHEGNTQQEREEHYKADDASSEVAHDTRSVTSDTENATLKHTDGSSELIIDGKENVSQSSNQPLLQKPIEATNSSDFRVPETMEQKDNLTVSENSSYENSTALPESNDHVTNVTKLELVQSNNVTQAQNATSGDNHIEGSKSNLTLSLVSHANASGLASDENQSVMNPTELANTSLGSSSEVKNLEVAENITGATEAKVDDVNLGESGTVDNLGSKTENNVTGEENESSIFDTAHDSVDDFASSLTQEENEARSDPGTLPDIKVRVENADDAEAE